MGLCASLPIAISPKLAGHYFLPSVPLFALGFASLALGPAASQAASRATSMAGVRSPWSRRVPYILAGILLVATVLVPVLHGPLGRRDTALLRDLDALGPAMPRGAIIGACQQVRSLRDWDVHSYMQRFYRVSLDGRGVPINGWLLQADGACTPPPTCMIAARGDSLALFRCSRAAR
jgi:hypothetical protein